MGESSRANFPKDRDEEVGPGITAPPVGRLVLSVIERLAGQPLLELVSLFPNQLRLDRSAVNWPAPKATDGLGSCRSAIWCE